MREGRSRSAGEDIERTGMAGAEDSLQGAGGGAGKIALKVRPRRLRTLVRLVI